jgi:hypothetical protein
MNKFLLSVLSFNLLISFSACLTTQGNMPLEEKAYHVPEICEFKSMKPESHTYIWFIDRELPLPRVYSKHEDLAHAMINSESETAETAISHEVDPHGLPLPTVPDREESVREQTTDINVKEITEEPQLKSTRPEIPQTTHPVNYSSTANESESPQVESSTEPPVDKTEIKSDSSPLHKRNIFARQGDDIEIVFDTAGWVYLGFEDKTLQDGLRYISKDSKRGKTIFCFKALQLGIYNLYFQLQDNISGMLLKELIAVKVITEDEFTSFMQNDSPSVSEKKNERDLSFANKLFELGQLRDSLVEYLKFYQEGDVFLNQRLAEIYFMLEDYRRAIHYWKKNLHAEGEYFHQAIAGLSQAYMNTDNYNELISHMRYLFTENNVPRQNDLVKLAKYFKTHNSFVLALELMLEYMKYYPYGEKIDEVYYHLGELYEKDTKFRNLKKSRDYYQKVLDEYPESIYADRACECVDYLNRHFFYVR